MIAMKLTIELDIRARDSLVFRQASRGRVAEARGYTAPALLWVRQGQLTSRHPTVLCRRARRGIGPAARPTVASPAPQPELYSREASSSSRCDAISPASVP